MHFIPWSSFPVTSLTLSSPFLSLLHLPSPFSHLALTHSFQLTTASLARVIRNHLTKNLLGTSSCLI